MGLKLDTSKWKTLVEGKITVTQKLNFVSGRGETLWEKEKILVTFNLSFSPNIFKRPLSQGE